jgi:hypothetical protein
VAGLAGHQDEVVALADIDDLRDVLVGRLFGDVEDVPDPLEDPELRGEMEIDRGRPHVPLVERVDPDLAGVDASDDLVARQNRHAHPSCVAGFAPRRAR